MSCLNPLRIGERFLSRYQQQQQPKPAADRVSIPFASGSAFSAKQEFFGGSLLEAVRLNPLRIGERFLRRAGTLPLTPGKRCSRLNPLRIGERFLRPEGDG